MDVELVRWPAQEARRLRLRERCRPRLLLVEEHEPAPLIVDPLEDWVRLPAADADVEVRVTALRLRAAVSQPVVEPRLDDDGVVRVGAVWTSLPPIEARLAAALLARFEKVVGRQALLDAGWPSAEPHRNVLDVHMLRLRRRLEPLGLRIRTVRKRGYILGW